MIPLFFNRTNSSKKFIFKFRKLIPLPFESIYQPSIKVIHTPYPCRSLTSCFQKVLDHKEKNNPQSFECLEKNQIINFLLSVYVFQKKFLPIENQKEKIKIPTPTVQLFSKSLPIYKYNQEQLRLNEKLRNDFSGFIFLLMAMFEMPKRTYKPNFLRSKRRHGFLHRMRYTGGRRIIQRRKKKGRKKLSD